jgi:Uma2 family endonuclease
MQLRPSFPHTDPPLSPRQTLPTMYDLPSENPEEPGLPDEFHGLQPQLLSRTLRLTHYSAEQIFTGADLNLYYDSRTPLWYKRPDWFLVLNVPRLYDGTELRASYVVWQEGVSPFLVVELLSPGTEEEDLGETTRLPISNGSDRGSLTKSKPPRKWEVYEQILRVPYYVIFSRYTNQLRFFQLVGAHYQEQVLDPSEPRVWLPELNLGLGIWQGNFEGVTRSWLRWLDQDGNWMLTDTEQERQLRTQVEDQLRQTACNLLQAGMTVAQVAQITGLSELVVQELSVL